MCPSGLKWWVFYSWCESTKPTNLVKVIWRWIEHKLKYWRQGGWFNIKMSSYQYRKSHCGDKTILRPSYLHNGISYTGKMTSLYWIRALVVYIPGTWSSLVQVMACPLLAWTSVNRLPIGPVPGNELHWHLSRSAIIIIQENVFEIPFNMSAILFEY